MSNLTSAIQYWFAALIIIGLVVLDLLGHVNDATTNLLGQILTAAATYFFTRAQLQRSLKDGGDGADGQ